MPPGVDWRDSNYATNPGRSELVPRRRDAELYTRRRSDGVQVVLQNVVEKGTHDKRAEPRAAVICSESTSHQPIRKLRVAARGTLIKWATRIEVARSEVVQYKHLERGGGFPLPFFFFCPLSATKNKNSMSISCQLCYVFAGTAAGLSHHINQPQASTTPEGR